MKKLHFLTIFFLLAAVSVSLTSCDFPFLNEPELNRDDEGLTLTEWIEPYHELNGSIESAKDYMASNLPRFELASEGSVNGTTTSLIYTPKDMRSAAWTYSFYNKKFMSAICSEYTVNLDLVVKCLKEKYIQEEVSTTGPNMPKILYRFTNEKKNLTIELVEVTK